jgi:hypothetical protein
MIHSPVYVFLSQRDGHCGCLVTPCVETGSQKTNLMLLCITLLLWRTACLYRNPALLRLPKSSQRTSKSTWFSHPYSHRRTRKCHEKLSPTHTRRPSHSISADTPWPKYSPHISQCSYLTLSHLNVIIYLPSTTLNFGFFRKVVRNQKFRANIRVTFLS